MPIVSILLITPIPSGAFPLLRGTEALPSLCLPQFRTENRYAFFLELLQAFVACFLCSAN
ncbi:hypothetical protein EH240_06755 [Mesorhizobium tamadayense]|uniref:Uncharacterized protein n=1 Tax=Mesorhizobium tamadayense TaxID=425306 RepID=A0A3P3G3F9_9HYPH|nr:hypothetical protein EH240_06755 [Mesorhizobium tamadayense]